MSGFPNRHREGQVGWAVTVETVGPGQPRGGVPGGVLGRGGQGTGWRAGLNRGGDYCRQAHLDVHEDLFNFDRLRGELPRANVGRGDRRSQRAKVRVAEQVEGSQVAALAGEQLPERRFLLPASRVGLQMWGLALGALESYQAVDFGLVLGAAAVRLLREPGLERGNGVALPPAEAIATPTALATRVAPGELQRMCGCVDVCGGVSARKVVHLHLRRQGCRL